MTTEDVPVFNGQQQEGLVAGPGNQPEINSQQASGNARQSQANKHVAYESITDSELSEGKNKRKIKVQSNLTAEEEDNIVEWLRGHPKMFDKRMTQYNNQQRTESLSQQKAGEMGTDITMLKKTVGDTVRKICYNCWCVT